MITIPPTWHQHLESETSKDSYQCLLKTITNAYNQHTIYPSPENIFRALNLCSWSQVKVVIIGQDPYHGVGQANGLAFSVNANQKIPPSLRNIFKEIESDLNITPLPSGDLTRWATQGVLLLNSVLTVQANTPASHKNLGWESFTDSIIRELNTHKTDLVYLLWGKYAQKKGSLIDQDKNLVLTSAHPSPFSVKHFFGQHHFSQCNTYLENHGKDAIDWK